MYSYDIVGYAHSEGFCLCYRCGDAMDPRMTPIFAGSEWDSAPACDICGEELDVCIVEDNADED